MKHLKTFLIIVLIVIAIISCKKSNSPPNDSFNKVTLTAILNITPGYTCSFNIDDGTTSANPIIFSENNISGGNRFMYQVAMARTLSLEFFTQNPKSNKAKVADITFTANGEPLNSFTVYDTGEGFYGTIGTTP